MVGLEDVSNIYDFINNYPDDDEKEQVEQCLKDIDDFYDDMQYLNDKYRYLFIPFKDREDFDRCCVNIQYNDEEFFPSFEIPFMDISGKERLLYVAMKYKTIALVMNAKDYDVEAIDDPSSRNSNYILDYAECPNELNAIETVMKDYEIYE